MVNSNPTASRNNKKVSKRRRTAFDKKKPLIHRGNVMAILFIVNLLVFAAAIITISSNRDLQSEISSLQFENSVLQEQNNRLEKDVELKNSSIDYLTKTLDTVTAEKDAEISRLINEIETLNNEYSFLRKDKLNSDEVQAVLLSEKYSYTTLSGEDLVYLKSQIERYDNLSSNDAMIDIILGLYHLESKYDPKADNSKSTARGLGQFLESTGRWIWETRLGNPKGSYVHTMAYDKKIMMEMTCNYLSYLLETYNGDIKKALIGYNGGELGEYYPRTIQTYLLSVTGTNVF